MKAEDHVNNYYLLVRLANLLDRSLAAFRLKAAYVQGRSELSFLFTDGETELTLKAWLGEQSFISIHRGAFLPPKHARVLFSALEGKAFRKAMAHPQDRSIRLEFEKDHTLVISLYGRNGNALLFAGRELKELMKYNFSKDNEVKLSDFDTYILPDRDQFIAACAGEDVSKAIKKSFPAITKGMMSHFLIGEQRSSAHAWDKIQQIEKMLLSAPVFLYTIAAQQSLLPTYILSLIPLDEEPYLKTSELEEALEVYAKKNLYALSFNSLKEKELQKIQQILKHTDKKLDSAARHLEELDKIKNYKLQADVIMANLHQIPKGSEEVELYDFYQDRQVIFPLKRNMSPQQWAEKLYQKSKKQDIEREQVLKHIMEMEERQVNTRAQLQDLQDLMSLRELKSAVKEGSKKEEKEKLPFRHFKHMGYDIYAGKGGENNDRLSFGFAHKEDLWLHAKDVSGSHVLIRHKARGAAFPEPVILAAAAIAAWYSKARSSGLCPVLYTLKKYVRKPKGAAPGKVICEKEKVVLVEPAIGLQ